MFNGESHGNSHFVKCKNIILSKERPFPLQRLGMRRRRLEFSDAFALVLQQQRTAKKLSKQELAQKAGLHQTYIGMIERGVSNPAWIQPMLLLKHWNFLFQN
ncbi:MAG: helix-turn-helix transcriptional regulator [Limisphaerales bacterium]